MNTSLLSHGSVSEAKKKVHAVPLSGTIVQVGDGSDDGEAGAGEASAPEEASLAQMPQLLAQVERR